MERLRVVPATWAALAILLVLGLVLAPAPATAADPRTGRGDQLLIDDAGWHGRPVQQPHQHITARTSAPALSGWSAGPAELGTGTARRGGSDRVREVQRRLRRLGYRPGPVDGIYGPRTRAAVTWFQHKHGLPRDGRAAPATVRHLRERTGATRPERPPAPDIPTPPAAPSASETTTSSSVVSVPAVPDDRVPWTVLAAALVAAGGVLLTLGLLLERRRRRSGLLLERRRSDAPEPAPSARQPRALGYLRLVPGAPSASFHAQAAAIESGCLARGMTLVSLVSDVEPDPAFPQRSPALAFALERLHSGEADRLVVSRLDHLAPTREELGPLLESLFGRQAGLVVLDRDVDTAALPGREAADALFRRDADPLPPLVVPRARRAIDAHIVAMLEEGASPEDAAAALNGEPVPPPHGGRWSREGVEAALRRRGGAVAERRRPLDA